MAASAECRTGTENSSFVPFGKLAQAGGVADVEDYLYIQMIYVIHEPQNFRSPHVFRGRDHSPVSRCTPSSPVVVCMRFKIWILASIRGPIHHPLVTNVLAPSLNTPYVPSSLVKTRPCSPPRPSRLPNTSITAPHNSKSPSPSPSLSAYPTPLQLLSPGLSTSTPASP